MTGPDGTQRGIPPDLHAVMANIAQAWHWPPSEMLAMTLPELMHWHALALERNSTGQ